MTPETFSVSLSLVGLAGFFVALLAIAVANFRPLFLASHGRSHRVAGGGLLLWLCVGVLQTVRQCRGTLSASWWWLYYDTVLGCLGITTTLTAARDFPHKYVQNAKGQSGSLSDKALVTQAEMVEHSFYQGLNLLQAWYLHSISTLSSPWQKWLALWLVTAPWLVRHRFPVHSFSHNWNITPPERRTPQEVLLYRIKKAQYLFYKHVLLHGLNITVAILSPSAAPTASIGWRVYWLALNTSYVMEFFLQTLVRRHFLSRPAMFRLQRWLMATSSVAAVWILVQLLLLQPPPPPPTRWMLPPVICATSLILNWTNRRYDVSNVLITAGLAYMLAH